MTAIGTFDYLEQYRGLREEILAAVERVLASGRLILGPELEAFEREFAAYLHPDGFGVGVNSGTDALAIGLRALRVGSGDEVITVANTAVPTVAAIREIGAIPVFVDVDERTCLMDLEAVEARITARTRAVVPVHLFGNVVDVPRLLELIGSRDVKVLEDCAQAHGARLKGRFAGTLGHAAAFSFYPTKNLGAYGDAGLCLSRDRALADRMRSLRTYGFGSGQHAEAEGVNSRLDELQAAVLRVKLPHLDGYLARRRELAAHYDRDLVPQAKRVLAAPGVDHARHLYVVQVDRRDAVREALARRKIATGVHYPVPVHRMRAYTFLGYGPGSLPRTERLAERVLSLPIYPELSAAAVDAVCEAVNEVVR